MSSIELEIKLSIIFLYIYIYIYIYKIRQSIFVSISIIVYYIYISYNRLINLMTKNKVRKITPGVPCVGLVANYNLNWSVGGGV